MTSTINTPYPAGLPRRLAALVYDSFVVAAITLLATAIVMFGVSLILGSPAITEEKVLFENPLVFSWIMFCWYYYYAWCWRTGGQTLGMKAWRLKLVPETEDVISYNNALIRFFTGFIGLANLSVLLPVKRGWHDILSKSDVVVIDKNT